MIWLTILLWMGTTGQDDPVQKLEERVVKLEQRAAFYQNSLITILVLQLGGLGGLLAWSHKTIKTGIHRRLEGSLGEIMSLVDADRQKKALKAASISVISPREKLWGTLADLGFRGARRQDLQGAEDHGRDLLVFDGDHLGDQEIQGVMRHCKDKVFLVYRHGRVNIEDERLTFTNSEISLFARLMEALRYRAIRK